MLLAVPAAAAADRPAATAVAQRGSLEVVARALLSDAGAELKGTWLDATRSCAEARTLRVSYQIDLVLASGATVRRRSRPRTGRVGNCAEGGPNFGFDVVARRLGMACANGAWRPGRYSIGVRATDSAAGLTASAHLYHQVVRC